MDADPDGKAMRAEMGSMLGRTSVPAIWIDGTYVGGCNDGGTHGKGIKGLERSGELDGMLEAAGAL